ncbi:glycoside hydrolase family 3 C-terminal domain-containing protein [Sphingomonas psychrotolerans]|uniref:Glycoside hydrolase family 3 C-terminal domain-containing protein n=1 Tax=Sphingomonas psychrotolerans TaxID=1327635 RepID=A0ABU3N3U3_9SPHN|nr:glycoside hydrolase family 3 C-terminal domain-containing protein [Sphingomonas psychrotolerans]MDT8759138.1 glycoside hydrolase family 3 C-terminal domain-containing protein [Sphingomonas psychrotolerans]
MTTKRLIGALLGSAMALASVANAQTGETPASPVTTAASARPWMEAKLTPDQRADRLLAAMTFEEKVALLHGPMAMPFSPAMPMPKGAVGSAGFIAGNERLGIPALQESDASLGVTNPMLVRGPKDMSTALPSGLALAATFDPAVAFAGGQMVGREARAKGLNVQLAGGANLARDPRNGRNFEYVGEDPLLAGVMAGEGVRGIQSTGMVSTVKHYAINDQEHNRNTVDAVIGEQAMRESDLLAFQIAIERGKPGSIMCAYNLINGVHACEHDMLLNQVLKRDWRYPGFVMSDWGAVHSLDAFMGGLDQQSGEQLDPQIWFDKPLKQAVAAGKIPAARVDDAARRVLRAMFAAGLFDQPAAGPAIDFAAHGEVALREAERAIVLLDNRKNLLPLAATAGNVVVIGGHAEAGVPSGMGSSQVTNPYRTSPFPPVSVPLGGEGIMALWNNVVFHPDPPLAALRAKLPKAQIRFDTGSSAEAAANAARGADVAIVFAYQPSGEGEDLPDMTLPFGQDAVIEAVAAANPNTIVVLETGNAVRMPWADKVGAVVQAWYGGSKGGEAIARVLTGEVNPSGRLPVTWPIDESQLPRPSIPGWSAGPKDLVKVDYGIEGSDVGYRWFARQGTEPRYWFGHGLSYTSFGHGNLTARGGKRLTASIDVTNSGARAGEEVVQLYLTERPGGPARRLLAFDKIALQPGETKRVSLTVDPRLLADYDVSGRGWRIAAGRYRVAIGSNAGKQVSTAEVVMSAAKMAP